MKDEKDEFESLEWDFDTTEEYTEPPLQRIMRTFMAWLMIFLIVFFGLFCTALWIIYYFYYL